MVVVVVVVVVVVAVVVVVVVAVMFLFVLGPCGAGRLQHLQHHVPAFWLRHDASV